jgi:hypothetical protein
MGRRLLLTGATAVAVIAGCGGSGATSTPAPTPTPATVLLISPAQLAAYTRTHQDPVTAEQLAGDAGDPAKADIIRSQGLLDGARATYQPRPDADHAFEQVISEALVFRDAGGATAFYADEQQRRARSPEGGGTVTPITGLTPAGVDQLTGFDARVAPQVAGGPSLEAFLFLMRRGAVVGELLGSGPSTTATMAAITPLLVAQEAAVASFRG